LSGENVLANVTNLNGDAKLRGELTSTARSAHLTINARVEMTPEDLQTIVEKVLKTSIPANIQVELDDMESLSPGRPTPTHRYKEVVGA
jgi:thiamine pyrophosphate-dependent acetolactate synthase large subunit-like protein